MRTIVVLLPVNEKQKKLLESSAPKAEFFYSNKEIITTEMIQKANIIIGNPSPNQIQKSSNLELLQLESAGADGYIKGNCLSDNTILTNATGAYGLAVSEHMLAMLFMVYKKLSFYYEKQKEEKWSDFGEVKSIYGSTVLIMGMGDIGGEFAEKIKALGAYTIGIRRTGKEKPAYLDELYSIESLDTLLPRADIVAMSLPQTKETYHIMDYDKLHKMKKDSVLINVGRGSAIDTDALCTILEERKQMTACLDVTEPEPLPEGHKLWNMPNAFITPHVSGGHHLYETFERIVAIAAENIKNYVEGKPLKNIVDFETGYRKL